MKKLTLFLAVAICAFFAACKKNDTVKLNTPLTGTWKLASRFISPGSLGSWNDVPQGEVPTYITFSGNGTLTSTLSTSTLFGEYANYAIKDSVTLKLTKNNSNDFQDFGYQIRKDTLEMSPAGPIMCIEGCAVRFIKLRLPD